MNKKEIISQLIESTRSEIQLLVIQEKEDIKAVTEEQADENILEKSTEEEVASINQKNQAVEDLQNQLNHLSALDGLPNETVGIGAIVRLNTGNVMVSTAFPSTNVGDFEITGISIESPLYKKMSGLKKGAKFHLTDHDTEFIILDVF